MGKGFLALAICLAMVLGFPALNLKLVKAESYGVTIVGEEVHVVFPNTCYIFYNGETHWELKDCAETFHFELPARRGKEPVILVDTSVAGRIRFGEYGDSLTFAISEDPVGGDHDQDPIHFLLHRAEEENGYDTCEDWRKMITMMITTTMMTSGALYQLSTRKGGRSVIQRGAL